MVSSVHNAVKGNAGLVAKIAVPPAAALDYDGDIKKVEINPEDKDDSDLTFLEAATGDSKDYTVKITALLSLEAGSFWKLLWDNPALELTFTYGPYGNAVPSASKPHFLMTIKTNGKPPVSSEARRTKERQDFEYECEVTAGPTLVIV